MSGLLLAVELRAPEKIKKKFEVPLSPVSPSVSSASTLAPTLRYYSMQSLSSSGTFFRRGSDSSVKSIEKSDYDPSSPTITAGEALFRALYGNPDKSVSITDFCSKLVKEFGTGRKVDLSSLALVIKPVNDQVTAKILDGYLFQTKAGIHCHPFAKERKMIFGIRDALSPSVIEFLKDLVSYMEVETPEQRLSLGLAYYHGVLLPQDYKIAYKYLESAAEKLPEAQAYVGVCKLHGRGTDVGDILSFKAFKASAKKRDPMGMFYLAKCYRYGVGCDFDSERSEKWLERAAVDYPLAQLELANYYITSKTPDYHKAIEFYKRAANNGILEAQFTLGSCYRHGYHVSVNYSEAVHYFRLAADDGHPPSQNNLAFLYQNGLGIPQDSQVAFKLFQLAAKKSCPEAQLNLGYMYENGYGCEKDTYMAFNLYTLAAGDDIAEAQHRLALCYHHGVGTEMDLQQALYWYKKAALQEYPPSMNNLALYYELVEKTKNAIHEAVRLLTVAAEKGDIISQYNLGDLYATGAQGQIPVDLGNARKYFQMASHQGDDAAKQRVKALMDPQIVRANLGFFKPGMVM
jgi:TPR repeat protein